MSHIKLKSRSKQRLKLSESQIQAYRAFVEKQTKDDYFQICHGIAELFEKSNLTIRQLAEISGVCEGTIKNTLHAKLKGIEPNTINRIKSAINTIINHSTHSDHENNGCYTIWLDDYRPHYCSELLQASLLWKKGQLPYPALLSSKSAADVYQSQISTGLYGEWIRQARRDVDQIVSVVYSYIKDEFDIICLTIGHGWSELKLAQSMWLDERCRLRNIYLICPSIHLLDYGKVIFDKQLKVPTDRRKSLKIIMGTHESYIRTAPIAWPRRRVFTLFGTLMNHDSIIDTLEKISTLATSGDMVIFDSHLPYGHPEDPRSILDRDPRLSGTLPLSYIKAVENMFEPVLQEADSTISRIAWSYEICKHINHSDDTLISYSIDMQADLIREHRHPQSISILRIHRTSPEAVVRNLAILRWKMVGSLLQGQLTDMNYPAQVYMFVKE